MKKIVQSLLIVAVIVYGSASLQGGEDAGGIPAITFRDGMQLQDRDRQILSHFIQHGVAFANGLTQEKVKTKCEKSPEMFCWVEFRYLNMLNIAYQLTGDTQYLDLFARSFQLFRNIMRKEHDKYLGWYGLPIKSRVLKDKPDLQIDELQMNSRAISILSLWVELAREKQSYATRQADTISSYLELMEQHLFPKWDDRGHFTRVAGRGGVYHGLDYPIGNQPTLSHEKLSMMVDAHLKLYRVTGKGKYLKRALEVGAWFKSNLSLKDGHYEWMSWVPAGKWDVHLTKEDSWKIGWIAPDPKGGWYTASLSIALNLYQHGLLFGDEDLKRFIKTQTTMCWNGDMIKPEYRTAAGVKNKWVNGRFLSYQLAHYDKTLEKLAFAGPHEAGILGNASNSWKGGANAQLYVLEKYIMSPLVKKAKQPYKKSGEAFLADKENKAFYSKLFFEVKSPGAITPTKPSQMFGKE